MAIQSQQLLLPHPDSPPDNGPTSLRQHIQSAEPLYNLHGSNMYSNAAQSNGVHIPDNYAADYDSQKSAKMSNMYRSSFASIPNATRPRHHQQQFRDSANNWPTADVFPSQLTSPTLQHMPPYDSRASFDLNGLNGVPKSAGFIDPFGKTASSNGYGSQNTSYPQLSSQTPFGPHLPANSGVQLSQGGLMNQAQNIQQEDISTIFVVGFPDDMQEREFQNMFTFSSGFEAATLKIPNKEYTAYGGTGPSGRNYNYSGSNDPYNLVTVNQGGVVVDGRDGTMASWPAVDDGGGPGPHYGTSTVPPRKQIIGFAKFRTKDEALAAKEMLQGKRVDIEKGAVLKAEMAKKNLHTKRGVGPVPGSATMPTSAGVGQGLGSGLGVISQTMHSDPYSLDPRDRDVGPLGAIGMNRVQWRDELAREREEEERWREQRELNVLGAIGLGTRGPRERAERVEEEDRDRRRREKEIRLRNLNAFDPFHPSPISRQTSGAPPGSNSLLSPLDNVNGFHNHIGQSTAPSMLQPDDRVIAGPWDSSNRTIRPPSSSRRTPSPPSETQRPYSPSHPQSHSQSDSRSSSVAGGSQHGGSAGCGSGSDEDVSQAMAGLAVSTSQGNTSPQLPSPASGASSGGSTRNGVDQNPPINTLYVGNLPTSPSPGIPPDVLEVSLRELFQTRPGFRRLSFKQKNSGPMCFVEFEDVQYATKTLNDLYGHTLNGLVKGGGIRLSYSKNPLGVRTPTSATSNGPSLQQQQNHFGLQEERPIIRRGVLPPPRFSASSAFETPLSSEFLPRNSSNMFAFSHSLSSFSPFGISNPSHSTIPDQSEPDQQQQRNDQHYHFIPRALSPHNIEAARAG